MQLNPISTLSDPTDAELVERSRREDRDSFGLIVGRYQSLVCALAYSACGNVSQSEDIAQEVFFSAWKQLRSLREPARLKEWLCGITRHTAVQVYRRDSREPAQGGLGLPDEAVAPEPLPSEQAVRREEEQVLWRALARLPETYRESLVLYYREHRSIEHVAFALDISEENVRQRLSRGRKLLQDEVTRLLEGALAESGPGPGFTAAVCGALPALAALDGAAAAGASAAKGGAAAKAGFFGALGSFGALGTLVLPLVGMFIQLGDASSPAERRKVMAVWMRLWAGCAVFVAGLLALSFGSRRYWSDHSEFRALMLTGVTVFFIFTFGAYVWKCFAGGVPTRSWNAASAAGKAGEFRSRIVLFGLPLVHIVPNEPGGRPALPAKGWIAIGRIAYGGIFACGTFSAAPVSIGAVSVGIISCGCIGIGGIVFGSLAIGGCALGAVSAGYLAWGGCAFGWHAAMGGAAWARDFALGSGAATHAAHYNGPKAWRAMNGMFFFRHADALFVAGMVVTWFPLFFALWRRRRGRSAIAAPGP